jgi:WD40 repeat protein
VLRLWDVPRGRQLRQFASDKTGTFALAFSPDGKRIAADTANTGIRLWDVAAGKEIRRLTGEHAGGGHGLAFSSDGKTLISGNGHDICWWDIGTGRLVRRLNKDLPSGSVCGQYAQLAASPDGKRLAAANDVLYLWDAAGGEEVRRIALGRRSWASSCLCFSPDGRTLACNISHSSRNETVLLAADTGRELRRWDEGYEFPSTDMAFSPDGRVLAQVKFGVIRVRDTATGQPIRPTRGFSSCVKAVKFLPGARALMVCGLDGRTGLWDPLTGKQVAPLQGPPKDFVPNGSPWHPMALTADGGKAALYDAKGVLHVWEAATGKACCRIADPPPCGEDGAVFSADGKVLAIGHRDSSLRLWDTATGKLLRSFPQAKQRFIRPLAFSPDGRILALFYQSTTAFSEAPVIHLWDTTTGEERGRLVYPEDTPPACLLFTADGRRVIASYDLGWPAGAAGHRIGLCVWEGATGRELWRSHGQARAIALSPDEKTLAAADADTIRLWELASGQERGRFTGHLELIRSLDFSPDGRLLASGSLDHTALVWDVTGMCPDGRQSSRDVRAEGMEQLWSELGGGDGVRAYRALWKMAASESQAVSFLARCLRPVPRVAEERLRRLIADLDGDQFEARQEAMQELKRLGERAEPGLRAALKDKLPLGARKRVEELLENIKAGAMIPESLRGVRAVEVLEQIGTPEARQLLRMLADGAPSARLTREAKASLERLARKSSAKP